jgi:hypothetical protein
VHHGIASEKRRREGVGTREVAYNGVAGNPFKILEITCFADEKTEVSTFGGESERHVVTYESGGTCKKNFHDRASSS